MPAALNRMLPARGGVTHRRAIILIRDAASKPIGIRSQVDDRCDSATWETNDHPPTETKADFLNGRVFFPEKARWWPLFGFLGLGQKKFFRQSQFAVKSCAVML